MRTRSNVSDDQTVEVHICMYCTSCRYDRWPEEGTEALCTVPAVKTNRASLPYIHIMKKAVHIQVFRHQKEGSCHPVIMLPMSCCVSPIPHTSHRWTVKNISMIMLLLFILGVIDTVRYHSLQVVPVQAFTAENEASRIHILMNRYSKSSLAR